MKESYFVSQLKKFRQMGRRASEKEKEEELRELSLRLLLAIPRGKKYKVARKIGRILVYSSLIKNRPVNNFKLAKCLKTNLRRERTPRLTKKRYLDKQPSYNEKIENCFRILKRKFRPLGIDLRFKKDFSNLIKVHYDSQIIQN